MNNVNKPLNKDYECHLKNQSCYFDGELGKLSVIFKQPPEIEEELILEFNFSSNIMLKSAWVEGDNMYMGRTPVAPENTSDKAINLESINALNEFKGIIFLGSCTEPFMTWNLYVEMEQIMTKETKIYSISFDTTQTRI